MSELNKLKELVEQFKETKEESLLTKLQKELEELEYSDRFKPYGLLFESQEEDVVKDFKGKKVIPTQVDGLNILKDENGKSNMLLEGDNYLALKLLEKTHKDSIDVIYIDPPYNTGNKDFVYNDHYVNNEDAYKHSKWLSFMNTRLQIARKLLKEDGVIFISIDDNEQAQLKLLCDKVFGEHNHISTSIRKTNSGGRNSERHISTSHEYLQVYCKNKESVIDFQGDVSSTQYNLHDSRGAFKLRSLKRDNSNASENMNYPIEIPNSDEVIRCPKGWRWGLDKVLWGIDNDYIVFKKVKGVTNVYFKEYMNFDNSGLRIKRTKPISSLFTEHLNAGGTIEIKEIFNKPKFSYPKPLNLLKTLIGMVGKENATVLDFFAGSGTTGHAVMELNKEDGGNRSFILATNNEVSNEKELQLLLDKDLLPERPTSKRGKPYKEWLKAVDEFKETPEYAEFLLSDDYQQLGIARSVTYERLKRVINGYTTPKGKEVEGIPNNLKYIKLDTVPESNIDYSQKDVVFFKEEVTEDLDADFYKGYNDEKVVYVVGDSEEVLDALEEAKEQHEDKEIVIYTDRLTRNEFNGKEELDFIKPFPKL